MAEFKLGRIRFVWKDQWTTSTVYYKDDVVKLGGRTYICTVGHTSNADFYADLDYSPTRWNLMSDGTAWKGDWTVSTAYVERDIVKYGGLVYVCVDGHTSAATTDLGLEDNAADWEVFAEGFDWKSDWATSTRYKVNDLVRYGGYTYVCNEAHTSASSAANGLENDQSKWTVFNPGLEYKGNWSGSSTRYKLNDVVKYGAGLWICTTPHISTADFATDESNWSHLVKGFEFEDSWNVGTTYQPGDVVRYGGNQYVAKTNHAGENPRTSTANWDLFAEGFNWQGDWSSATSYRIGDVVSKNAYTYLAITDSSNQEPPNATYWERLNAGLYNRGEWIDDVYYYTGDVVRYGSNSYVCILTHRSEGDDGSTIGPEGGGAANSRPDQDTSGTYWNVLSIGNETEVLTTTGDLVYYSGAGPARLPVGVEGQVLRVSSTAEPEWATLGKVDYVYHVGPHGTDQLAPIHGLSLDKPWKTIRYACEQVENGPRNPEAKKLLELNRVFIQREVTEWIDYQINYYTNTAPDVASIWYNFDYDEYKCERDTGFIVDALIHDLGHGGNVKIRGAANSYVGGLSESETETYGVGLGNEDSQSVAALTYMLDVVEAVLNQEAPAVNYQTTNGDNSTSVVAQYIDANLTAESSAFPSIQSLVSIVTDTITAGNADNIPERYSPNNLIKIATGQYREVLPIIVPEQTCLLGDELRSTNAGPRGGTTPKEDSFFTQLALGHLSVTAQSVVQGSTVTATTGNTEAQSQAWPYATSDQAAGISDLMGASSYNIRFRTGYNLFPANTSSDPTNYNTSYLVGYGNARYLIRQNKEYFKAEVTAWITTNYPNLKYSKTKCKQDVGYIVDAMVYDLTYGGNAMSVQAGLAYWEGAVRAIDSTEITATTQAYSYLKSIMQSVAGANLGTSLNSTVSRYIAATAGSAAAISFVGSNMDEIIDIITNGTGAASLTDPSTTWVSGALTTAYSTLQSAASTIVNNVIDDLNEIAWHTDFIVSSNNLTNDDFEIYVGKNDITHTYVSGGTVTKADGTVLTVSNFVYNNSTGIATVTTSVDHELSAADIVDIESIVVSCSSGGDIGTAVFPSALGTRNGVTKVRYIQNKCIRDIGIILKAVGYDFMFNSQFQTELSGRSYLRSTASEVFSLGQKAITRTALENVRTEAIANVGGDSTAIARINASMELIDHIIFSGSYEGSRCASAERVVDYAVLQLERNRDFLVAEVNAYIADTFKATITDTTAVTNVLTIGSGLDQIFWDRNLAVRFTGTTFGGITAGTTYYIQYSNDGDIKISTTKDSNTPLTLSTASGSMTMEMVYDEELCQRDMQRWIDAVKYDLKYPGNYKTLYCSRYYGNAVVGSYEEDMYYLRDATGVRDQTLEGLNGDLLPENAYGTSRVSAGAYCSLDPGWGPEDYRAWIISRSPYIQGLTTFGNAAIGQKIDGALHNGGNDSMVSNDFTQVISDGIGAWVENNGRAELVSVFTYYSHIGYLATNGGRIRGTNGNNSYGDFGSVAEGFDTTETPNTAIVDNKFQYVATIGSVNGSGSVFYTLEYDNAGIDYSEVTYTLTGGGIGASAVGDEFRDDSVFEVRLLDLEDDSSGQFGGSGYITASNTAQGGTSTQIILSATDQNSSTAYVGMRLSITAGSGVGQYGIIDTYNSGSKIATILSETAGVAGWDHIVPGTPIVNPDGSSVYVIEPAIAFTAPGFSASATTITSGTYNDVVYGDTTSVVAAEAGTYTGLGNGATFNIIRNGWKYIATVASAGTGYTRLETITVAGTDLGGTSPANDLTITVTAVNSITGAIQAIETSGNGRGGRFVAVKGTSTNVGVYSNDGETWTNMTLPSSQTWTGVAHGMIDDGSSVGKVSRFVAIASGTTAAAWSADGITWTASVMPASVNWKAIIYGGGRFVAISSDSTDVAISLDGEYWDITGTLTATGFTDITYGKGKFAAIKPSSTVVSTSSDGVSWTDQTLPASSTWTSIAWGRGVYVAVASDTNSGAISNDGTNWYTMTMGSVDSSTSGYQRVRYGQGLFMATAYLAPAAEVNDNYSWVATSEDGLTWTPQGLPEPAASFGGYNALAFGNPQRTGTWITIGYGATTHATKIRTGARAKARAFVADNRIFAIRLYEPGSGYDSIPTMTVTDPNNTYELPFEVRTGRGVLANPTFLNRGSQYSTASAEVDTGDGYADFYQAASFVAVRRITQRPVPGSNVVFSHLPERTFKLVNVVTFRGEYDGSYTAFYQISPALTKLEAPEHGTSLTTRIRYSQVRLTGHDFLDIGTGGFADTNYPNAPVNDPAPANETVEGNGGRVFFTATDQDGNFRVGDLFSVEQATGIATLNADAFNISGLQEISLGEVTLGGGSATISEFSTDPFFTADSDSVIPTQRAIKAYISSQIGGGGASLNVNSVTAGQIVISTNQINTTDGSAILLNGAFEFRGSVTGYPMAFQYFLN